MGETFASRALLLKTVAINFTSEWFIHLNIKIAGLIDWKQFGLSSFAIYCSASTNQILWTAKAVSIYKNWHRLDGMIFFRLLWTVANLFRPNGHLFCMTQNRVNFLVEDLNLELTVHNFEWFHCIKARELYSTDITCFYHHSQGWNLVSSQHLPSRRAQFSWPYHQLSCSACDFFYLTPACCHRLIGSLPISCASSQPVVRELLTANKSGEPGKWIRCWE